MELSSGIFHCTHSNGIGHTVCEQDQDGTIIRNFSLYTQQWYMSYSFADSLRAGSGWNCSFHPDPSCKLSAKLYDIHKPVWHIPLLCVQWKTPDDGQRSCPKLVVSFQNKFEELVHLVGFIIRKKLCCSSHTYSLWTNSLLGCYREWGTLAETSIEQHM
jgi:hypothetical protein